MLGPVKLKLPRVPAFAGRAIFDREVLAFTLSADPLVSMLFDSRWVLSLGTWLERIAALPDPSITTPIKVLQGTKDKIVDWPWNLRELRRIAPSIEIEMHPGLCHALLQERPSKLPPIHASIIRYLQDH
jgi:alpha-beta hydrolase superfamily lysophospholipase